MIKQVITAAVLSLGSLMAYAQVTPEDVEAVAVEAIQAEETVEVDKSTYESFKQWVAESAERFSEKWDELMEAEEAEAAAVVPTPEAVDEVVEVVGEQEAPVKQ